MAQTVVGIYHISYGSLTTTAGLGPCSTLPEELALHAADENATIAVRQSNESTNEQVKPLPVSNAPSINNASDMDMAGETRLTNILKPTALSLEPTDPRVGGGSFFLDPINDVPDDKQVRQPVLLEEILIILS